MEKSHRSYVGIHYAKHICYTCRKHFPVLSSFMTYHRVCNQINTTGTISGTGTAYPSGTSEFTPGFQRDSCQSIFSCMCVFCRSLCVLFCSFFCWPFCCLFYFDLHILITSLISSKSSYPKYTNFAVENFTFSSIPSAPVFGVCISQLTLYSRAFLCWLLLTRKLLSQEFLTSNDLR